MARNKINRPDSQTGMTGNSQKRTEIFKMGEFGLVEHITKKFKIVLQGERIRGVKGSSERVLRQ